jgi:hypothetical protein
MSLGGKLHASVMLPACKGAPPFNARGGWMDQTCGLVHHLRAWALA